MGDLNAKVGSERIGREREIGPHGIGNINENGELFSDFCAVNRLVIGGTLFPHKNCHKITWVSPTGNAENQIDHIAISQRWRSSLQDVRNKRGDDAASDHHLLTATIKLKLLSHKKAEPNRRKFHVAKFKEQTTREEYQISLHNRFSALTILDNADQDINSIWEKTKTAIIETYKETIGYVQHKWKKWMSDETWARVEKRRQAKQKVLNATTRSQKCQAQDFYTQMDREVKKNCKKVK